MSVDHLLLLHYLLRHTEITTSDAAKICQRSEKEAREILSEMERTFEYLDRGGTGRGTYWMLRSNLYKRIAVVGHPERDKRIEWEAAKTRVLSILRQRAEHQEPGLSNTEIRQMTHYNRNQVIRLMQELMAENKAIQLTSKGRYARYVFRINMHEHF